MPILTMSTITVDPANGVTWPNAIQQMGTYEPRVRNNLTINYASANTDNTQPFVFDPFYETGPKLIVTSTPTAVCGTGATLTSVTNLARGTNLLLAQVNLQGGGACTLAANELVCDTTTTPNTCAWTYAVSSGSIWKFSAPWSAHVAGTGDTTRPTAGTWTANDAVTVQTFPNADFAEFTPHVLSQDATYAYDPEIYRLNMWDPGGSQNAPLWVGASVYVVESNVQRNLMQARTNAIPGQTWLLNNTYQGNVYFYATPSNLTVSILGGIAVNNAYFEGMVSLDDDFIIDTFNPTTFAGTLDAPDRFALQAPNVGTVYIETGKKLLLAGNGRFISKDNAGNAPVIYGGGLLNLVGNARWVYPSGAGAAAAAFKQTGGFQLNGQTSCYLVVPNGTVTTGKTLSAANLDTDLGGTSACYCAGGGPCICNYGP
jgi:hypothetical protein